MSKKISRRIIGGTQKCVRYIKDQMPLVKVDSVIQAVHIVILEANPAQHFYSKRRIDKPTSVKRPRLVNSVIFIGIPESGGCIGS